MVFIFIIALILTEQKNILLVMVILFLITW